MVKECTVDGILNAFILRISKMLFINSVES